MLGFCEIDGCFEFATVEKILNMQVTSLCEDHFLEIEENGRHLQTN